MNASRASSFLFRRLVGLVAAVMLLGTQPTYGQNGAVGIAYPAKGITVDGDLSDWPGGLKSYPIERVESGDNLVGKDDLKACFRIAYDASGHALYVAVEVDDDSIVLDGPGEARWDTQDGCELFIDAAHAGGDSPIVIQYARYGNQNRVVGPPEASEKTMKVAVARTDSRIVYEWRIEVGSKARSRPGDRVRRLGGGQGQGRLVLVGRVGEGDAEDSGARPVRRDPPRQPGNPIRRGLRQRRLERPVPGGPPLPGPDPVVAVPRSCGAGRSWIRRGPTRPRCFPRARTRSMSWIRRTCASTRSRTSTSRSRPTATAKADLLRVTPIPWPGLIGAEGVLRESGALNPDELDRFVQAYLDYFKIPGISVAVIKDSRVVYHRGFGVKNTATGEPVADDTVFEAASMTKPVFAYTVLRLVDRGVLDLDTPLYTYLPYEDIAHDDRYKLITARMVLTHRTGFPNWRSGKLDIKFTPGTQVSYSGEGFVYLGKVVEHLTGKKLVDLCREEVFAPLGIENASLVWNENVARLTATGHAGTSPLSKGKPDQPNMAASLHVDAGNYAKFLIAVLQGKGLSKGSAEEMLRAQVKIPDQQAASWGLGIAIEETPVGTNYGHGGRNTGFTSRSVMYKDLGIGYVFLVNNDDASKMDNVLNAYLIAGKSGLKNTSPSPTRWPRSTRRCMTPTSAATRSDSTRS